MELFYRIMENQYMLTILSLLLGILVGLERYQHRQAIGFRTLGMACTLGCGLAILSLNLNPSGGLTVSVGRLVGQLLVGVGFIGMGVIVKKPKDVMGLTTAMGLLGVIVVGAIIGFGFPFYGSFIGFIIYGLFSARKLELIIHNTCSLKAIKERIKNHGKKKD